MPHDLQYLTGTSIAVAGPGPPESDVEEGSGLKERTVTQSVVGGPSASGSSFRGAGGCGCSPRGRIYVCVSNRAENAH